MESIQPIAISKPNKALDIDYEILQRKLVQNARNRISEASGFVFRIKTEKRSSLFDTFIDNLEENDKQYHRCSCCKSFFRRYAGLVTIDPETGVQKSVLWNEDGVPGNYYETVKALRVFVENSNILSSFLLSGTDKPATLGDMIKNDHNHFYIESHGIRQTSGYWSAERDIAEESEDVRTLRVHLSNFELDELEVARHYFDTDEDLKLREKERANLNWFFEYKKKRDDIKNRLHKNSLDWYMAATQPKGRTHFGNTVTGEFVNNLKSGNGYQIAKSKFIAMTKPEVYMRPVAAPSAGNVQEAERLIATLGLEKSLERRFLRVDEISNWFWSPNKSSSIEEKQEGIFSHLVTKDEKETVQAEMTNGGDITWEKFEKQILPSIDSLSIVLSGRCNIVVYTTAVHPDAPPLIKWDKPDNRNPVTGYSMTNGRDASDISLTSNKPIDVIGITYEPDSLVSEKPSVARFLVLAGSKETIGVGSAIFPDNLIPELYPIRSTMESFSKSKNLEGMENSFAGFYIGPGAVIGLRVITTKGKFKTQYRLTKFD